MAPTGFDSRVQSGRQIRTSESRDKRSTDSQQQLFFCFVSPHISLLHDPHPLPPKKFDLNDCNLPFTTINYTMGFNLEDEKREPTSVSEHW